MAKLINFKNLSMIILLLLFVSSVRADTIILKSGENIQGHIVEQTSDFIKIDVGGVGITYFTEEIDRVDKAQSQASDSKSEDYYKVSNKTVDSLDSLERDLPADTTYPVTGEAAWAIHNELLEKWDTFGPVRYEVHFTSTPKFGAELQGLKDTVKSQGGMMARVWEEGWYIRKELTTTTGKKILSINHPDFRYKYQLTQKQFIKKGPSRRIRGLNWQADRTKVKLRILGTELLDGKETLVLEQTFPSIGRPGTRDVSTAWVWSENGFALKTTTEFAVSEQMAMVNTSEVKDLVFEDIPDHLFDIQMVPATF